MLVLRILQGILIVGALLPVLSGCSSKPVYEHMSTSYNVNLDLRHDDRIPVRAAQYNPEDVRDEDIDMINGLLYRELKARLERQQLEEASQLIKLNRVNQ